MLYSSQTEKLQTHAMYLDLASFFFFTPPVLADVHSLKWQQVSRNLLSILNNMAVVWMASAYLPILDSHSSLAKLLGLFQANH